VEGLCRARGVAEGCCVVADSAPSSGCSEIVVARRLSEARIAPREGYRGRSLFGGGELGG
jgi:hypothetical protein